MDDSCCPTESMMILDDETERLPLYMDYSNELMYQTTMDKRSRFATFVDTKIPQLKEDVSELLINLNRTENTVAWIGGSRSWKKLYDTHSRTIKNSALITSSAGTAGNYDIFVLYSDSNNFQNLFDAITSEVKAIHRNLIASIGDAYDINIKYPKGKKMKGEMCAIFPCVSIAVELTSRPVGRRTTTATNLKLENKLLLYVEVGLYSRIDVNLVRQRLLTPTYHLNAIGLFLFSQFILSPRRDKDINVEMYRDLFIQQLMAKSNVTLSTTLFETAKTYTEIFQHYMNQSVLSHHDVFVNDLYIKASFTWYEQEKKFKINDYYTFIVAETVRPLIQTGVALISKVLKHHYDSFKAHIFLVGGDAMRRYIPSTVQTNDFDTKIMYSKNDAKLLELCISCLVLLTTMLEHAYYLDLNDWYTLGFERDGSKFEILIPKLKARVTNRIETNTDALANGIGIDSLFDNMNLDSPSRASSLDNSVITMPTTTTNTNTTKSINIDSGPNKYYTFRPRVIDQSEFLPVDLLSIDMNIPIVVRIRGMADISWKLTIPIFDMVLQKVDKPNPMFDVREYNTTVLPVASPEFLIKDLEKTYNNESLAKMRFFNAKKEKDIKRLTSLRKSTNTYDSRLDNVLFFNKTLLASETGQLWNHIKDRSEMFRNKLKTVMCSNKRKGYVKHKLAFSKSIVESIKITKRSCALFKWNEMIYDIVDMNYLVQRGGGNDRKLKYSRKAFMEYLTSKNQLRVGGKKLSSLQKDYHKISFVRKGKL